jgi:hypothetical protein
MRCHSIARRLSRFIGALVVVVGVLHVSVLAQKTVHVKGYVKKDGTVVKPHDRRAPGSKEPGSSGAPTPAPSATPSSPTPTPSATTTAAEWPDAPPPVRVASPSDDPRAVVIANAPIYLLPDANRTPLRTAAINTSLRVLENTGAWLKVKFRDPQLGLRQGYIQAQNVRLSGAGLQPMDLSVPPVQATSANPVVPATVPVPLVASAAVASPPTIVNETVYVTRTGSKYHRAACRSLAKSAIPMKLGDAARVYGPCAVCRPPAL